MASGLVYLGCAVLVFLCATALFFFLVTRGALLLRQVRHENASDTAHVYPLYSNSRLIRLVDFQPVISAILLFQYHRLVSAIARGLGNGNLRGKDVLVTACAFGNVLPRLVSTAIDDGGANRVVITDIIDNELTHAARKLTCYINKVNLRRENAIAMKVPDGAVAANIMFFLLHELPHDHKVKALREAVRVLEPGGRLYLAEFHRPQPLWLRMFSWTYFKVFEPLGLALWDSHDPMTILNEIGGLACTRQTFLCGNFQVLVACKK